MTRDWQDATSSGDAVRVASMLDAGADINALDGHGQTALMNAAHKGHAEVVRLLSKRGANLDHTAKFGLSALMLAVIADHPEVVRVLVDAGADITLRGSPSAAPIYDKTALELAEQMKRTRCAEELQRAETKHKNRT
ncbi:MAG: ankyrin repeat domain-containing protein [Verrucomicrobiota bacterium]|nr:ankyrin repeat domain-containing protein [Verrucomicrobiota bacterium]MCC6822421.1 ankyrin repeat domain-containing protein [Limisphaerales bacterium]